MRVPLAVLANIHMLLGSAREPARRSAFDSGGLPEQHSPRAGQWQEMHLRGAKNFELPISPGEELHPGVHYLGFCGSLRKELWTGGRWVGLAVLANIALSRESFIAAFPLLADTGKKYAVRWLVTAGSNDTEEVEQAVRLLRGNWKHVPWSQPVDILIGCGSGSTTEAVAGEAAAASTPLISPTPFTGSRDSHSYFFRTRPSDSETVKGFLDICKHFGWMRVGLLYQQPQMWSLVESLRNQDPRYPFVDSFLYPDAHMIGDFTKSHLRVFGLATSYSTQAMAILRAASDLGIMDRVWIVFGVDIWRAMSDLERRTWSGMMVLEAIDLSCCTKLALELEAIWHTLSFQTLIEHHVPEQIVTRMRQENHDLFQQSPWQGQGAFFFDAILMALLAFKHEDESVASAGSDHVPGQFVPGIVKDVRINGVSGFPNYTKHSEARMYLRQLRAGAYVTVAGLVPEVIITNQVIFPNGGSNPRAYDYNPQVLPLPETSHDADVELTATLNLGFCGNIREMLSGKTLPYPGVIALAKKTMGTDSAVMHELKQLPFHISWHWGFSDNAHDELEAAMGLLSRPTSDAAHPPLDFLIGCTSDRVTINAAAKAATEGVIQITPYMFTSRFEQDPFPFIFRTSVTSRDYAEGIVAIMRYFGWTGIGVINDRSARGQALTDSVELACRASGVRLRTSELNCTPSKSRESADDIFCDSQEDTSTATMLSFWRTSGLRVFVLAVDPKMFHTIARATLQEPRHGRVFVAEGLTTSTAVLDTETGLGMQGWLSLDHPQRGNTEVASRFRKAWQSMEADSVAGLLDHVVPGMQRMAGLYRINPFSINNAHVLDAIVLALLAAKASLPSVKAGRFHQQDLLKAMNNISFDGVSGHISFLSDASGTGSNAGDLAHAALTIRQVQKGQLVRLGTVDRLGSNEVARTWRVSLHQGRSYNTLQYHASGHSHQNVPAQTDNSSSTIKIMVGVSLAVVVCVAIISRYEVWRWARTRFDVQHPGEPSPEARHLRTAHHDEEAVKYVTE